MKKFEKHIFLLSMLIFPLCAKAEVTPFMQRRCDDFFSSSPIDVEINYDYGELEYDTSKSTEEMAKLFSAHNSGRIPENTVNGLTVQCYYPSKITVDTGFKDTTIYIANRLKSGSCRFELTKRHEQTHLALGKAGLDAQIALIRKMLPAIVKKHGAIVSEESKDVVEQELFDAYNNEINQLRQMMNDATNAEQQKLDTA